MKITHRTSLISLLAAAIATFAAQTPAQWFAKSLPAGYGSEVKGADADFQVGTQEASPGVLHAITWQGTPLSIQDLNPLGATVSLAYAAHNGVQVGAAQFGGPQYACLWNGTMASYTNLNPAGSTASEAFGVHNGKQVGYAMIGGVQHAGTWAGSAATWYDLQPPGAVSSAAFDIFEGRTVGAFTTAGNVNHACLWLSTPNSVIDLSPAGSSASVAYGATRNVQVGVAFFGGNARASLWYGSAGSWVDLTPAGSTNAYALAAYGLYQVGVTGINTTQRAAFWTGSAASHVDLHSFLPSNYIYSRATAISADSRNFYVGGWAYNNTTGRTDAIVWRRAKAWIATNLHSFLSGNSLLRTAYGPNQYGYYDGVGRHAYAWNGTVSNSDYHPAGATISDIYGSSDLYQVGGAAVGGNYQASLWTGSAGSWVNLNPVGATASLARGVWGTDQVGYAIFGGVAIAAKWSGNSASFVNLHPAGATASSAQAIQGAQQGGFATFGGADHAGIWSGTAASWVDLHPGGATSSEILGMSGNGEVGRAVFAGNGHASRWRGNVASWVDLHPAGALTSIANAMTNEVEVGQAYIGGMGRASLWKSTAASWEDLHIFVPEELTAASSALGVTGSGTALRIAGVAYDNSGNARAMMWEPNTPELGAFTITPSPMAGGGIATGTVQLTLPASPGGTAVTILENTSYLQCPASVVVPAGATQATFPITTYNPPTTITKEVEVQLGTTMLAANITLTPISMVSFTVTPSSLCGGPNLTGTITLSAPAPPGFTIGISDNSALVQSPPPVAFTTGATTKTFSMYTFPTATTQTAIIYAKKSTQTLSQTITFNAPALNYLAVSTTVIKGGLSFNATPQLTGQAFLGGITVTMSSSGPEMVPPLSLLILYRTTQKMVSVTTNVVAVTISRTLSATYNGVTKTRTISITP